MALVWPLTVSVICLLELGMLVNSLGMLVNSFMLDRTASSAMYVSVSFWQIYCYN